MGQGLADQPDLSHGTVVVVAGWAGVRRHRKAFHHGTTVEAATCGRRPWTGEGAIAERRRRRQRQRQRHRTLGGRERAAASPKPERPVAVLQASA
jgi:hypothetical protein